MATEILGNSVPTELQELGPSQQKASIILAKIFLWIKTTGQICLVAALTTFICKELWVLTRPLEYSIMFDIFIAMMVFAAFIKGVDIYKNYNKKDKGLKI